MSTSIIINSLRHRLIITRWANFFVLLSRFGLSALYLHCTPDPTRAGLASLHRCTLYSQRFVLWSCYCNCTAVEIWFNSHWRRVATFLFLSRYDKSMFTRNTNFFLRDNFWSMSKLYIYLILHICVTPSSTENSVIQLVSRFKSVGQGRHSKVRWPLYCI